MKDPAFLFYSNDFLTGTYLMTDEQTGKYIRLLCLQHQKGHLQEKDMINICKTNDNDIFDKFTIDADGLYYNERLEFEIEKRSKYTNSRKMNRLGKFKKVKSNNHMKNISKSYVKHMENENENEIKDIIIINSNKVKTEISPKHEFQCFCENLSNVKKLKSQLTFEEAEKLLLKYPKELILETFEAMENWKPLTQKSNSVYLTCNKWCKLAFERNNGNEKGFPKTKQSYTGDPHVLDQTKIDYTSPNACVI